MFFIDMLLSSTAADTVLGQNSTWRTATAATTVDKLLLYCWEEEI